MSVSQKRPGPNAYIPILLVKNGQASVKMVPYSILQRAMGKIRHSRESETVTNWVQSDTNYDCRNDAACPSTDSDRLGLVITDVKSISKTDYDTFTNKHGMNSPALNTDNCDSAGVVVRSEPEPELAPGSQPGDTPAKERILKMKISRQRSDVNTPNRNATWRVVTTSLQPEELVTLSKRKGDHCSNTSAILVRRSLNHPDRCGEDRRDVELHPGQRRRAQEFKENCARCVPFGQTRKSYDTDQPRKSVSSLTLSTGRPLISTDDDSPDSWGITQPQAESSKRQRGSQTNTQWRQSLLTMSVSASCIHDSTASPRGDHSSTDTTASLTHSAGACKRRRLSASSSGDFHQSIIENTSNIDTSDNSDTDSELEDCSWIYNTPNSKPAIIRDETTPSLSRSRHNVMPPVFQSPRDELIYNLKRTLKEQSNALDNLKLG